MADKYMDRISKLLNTAHDESATKAERDLAMERAVYLSQAHSIDLELARMHAIKKTEVQKPERRSHRIGDYRDKSGRAQEKRLSHFVDLFLVIAGVYDLRCTIGGGNTAVHAVGYPADHDLVERMYSILSVQMVQEADAALARGENKTKRYEPVMRRVEIPEDDRDWGGYDYDNNRWYCDYYDRNQSEIWNWETNRYVKPHLPPKTRLEPVTNPDGSPKYAEQVRSTNDARVWRSDYYKGFVSKLGRRLREEKKQAYADAGVDLKDDSNEKGLAIIDKKEQVTAAYEEEVQRYVLETGKELGTYKGSGHTRDWSAHQKGQKAADRAVTGNERVVPN